MVCHTVSALHDGTKLGVRGRPDTAVPDRIPGVWIVGNMASLMIGTFEHGFQSHSIRADFEQSDAIYSGVMLCLFGSSFEAEVVFLSNDWQVLCLAKLWDWEGCDIVCVCAVAMKDT